MNELENSKKGKKKKCPYLKLFTKKDQDDYLIKYKGYMMIIANSITIRMNILFYH